MRYANLFIRVRVDTVAYFGCRCPFLMIEILEFTWIAIDPRISVSSRYQRKIEKFDGDCSGQLLRETSRCEGSRAKIEGFL